MALVPLESLAMGTPVVASDVTGVREAVCVAGCGVVVPPGSPGVLAQALNTWLAQADEGADVEARLARRTWIAESFAIDTTVDILDATLRGLIAERS
jgi:glycosyltransferase involved in cell wall biosynthesis